MLCGCTVSGGRSDIVNSIIAHKGSGYFDLGWILLHSPLNIQMQNQKLLILRWRLSLEGGSDLISSIVDNKGGRYFDYGLRLLHSPVMVQNAWP